jgi:hypothetical protein
MEPILMIKDGEWTSLGPYNSSKLPEHTINLTLLLRHKLTRSSLTAEQGNPRMGTLHNNTKNIKITKRKQKWVKIGEDFKNGKRT